MILKTETRKLKIDRFSYLIIRKFCRAEVKRKLITKKKFSIYNEGLIFCYLMCSSISKKNMNTPIEKGKKDVNR